MCLIHVFVAETCRIPEFVGGRRASSSNFRKVSEGPRKRVPIVGERYEVTRTPLEKPWRSLSRGFISRGNDINILWV